MEEKKQEEKNMKQKKWWKNKYLITLFLFLVYMIFFDSNNLIDRSRNRIKINRLKKEISYYDTLILHNREKMNLLQSNDENMEKFAREQFLMKKNNEDIFIIKQ